MKRPNASIKGILDLIDAELLADGTPVNAVNAQGTLTVDTQPTATDTMVIGDKTYTFVADGSEANDGDISVGTDLATAQANIVDAINGDDAINTASEYVTAGAFGTNVSTLTAITAGVSGNTIETTETFTAVTNIFDANTLGTETAGVDGTVGEFRDSYLDSSYLYVAIADNTISGANWRRIDLGSEY